MTAPGDAGKLADELALLEATVTEEYRMRALVQTVLHRAATLQASTGRAAAGGGARQGMMTALAASLGVIQVGLVSMLLVGGDGEPAPEPPAAAPGVPVLGEPAGGVAEAIEVVEDVARVKEQALAAEVAELIELLAIIAIVIGVIAAFAAGIRVWSRDGIAEGVERFKRVIARGLLVGLDLLIAADVIKTVTLEGTIESAVVLGILVVIRTFLSWTLVLEIKGQWPWQLRKGRADNGQVGP